MDVDGEAPEADLDVLEYEMDSSDADDLPSARVTKRQKATGVDRLVHEDFEDREYCTSDSHHSLTLFRLCR